MLLQLSDRLLGSCDSCRLCAIRVPRLPLSRVLVDEQDAPISRLYSRYASFFIHCAGFKNMSAVQDNPVNRPLHEIHFIK